MKIDIEKDCYLIHKKLKFWRVFNIFLIFVFVLTNFLFVYFANYFNKKEFMILSSVSNVILIFLILCVISLFTLRYKRILKYLINLYSFEEGEIYGKILNISNELTLEKGIVIREITLQEKDEKITKINVLANLYEFDLKLETFYKLIIKNKVLIGVKDDD